MRSRSVNFTDMKAVSVAVRRSAIEVAGPVVVRAGVALGHALAVFASALWLLISLIRLGQAATSG